MITCGGPNSFSDWQKMDRCDYATFGILSRRTQKRVEELAKKSGRVSLLDRQSILPQHASHRRCSRPRGLRRRLLPHDGHGHWPPSGRPGRGRCRRCCSPSPRLTRCGPVRQVGLITGLFSTFARALLPSAEGFGLVTRMKRAER